MGRRTILEQNIDFLRTVRKYPNYSPTRIGDIAGINGTRIHILTDNLQLRGLIAVRKKRKTWKCLVITTTGNSNLYPSKLQ